MVGFGRRRRTQRVRPSDIEWLERLDPSPAFAEEPFDPVVYKKREMIKGIFGIEETKHHRLYCRFCKKAN